MSLSNPNLPVTEQRLQEFYHKLLPYMGGGGAGGGHTIEDSEGTDLTQRDTLQFGEGFKAEDDSTNEKTVISPDVMQSGDINDVVTPLPSVAPKKEGIKYSTTEQVVGEWIDGKPLYQKTFVFGAQNSTLTIDATNLNIKAIIAYNGYINMSTNNIVPIPCEYNSNQYVKWLNFTHPYIYLSVSGFNNITELYLTVQYTKTTD